VEGVKAVERFPAARAAEALQVLRRDGVVVLDGLWPPARLEQLRQALARRHPEYFELRKGWPYDGYEVGKLRFTCPLVFAPPFDCADVLLHPALSELFIGALGESYVFEAMGVICALPGATLQHIHNDGGQLFPETGVDSVLPPVALTFSVPLLPQDALSGMTAFWPGSHRSGDRVDEDASVAPEVPLGSCVLWDFRIYHRGLPNLGPQARPLLYVTVCRSFWIDDRNFRPDRGVKLLASGAAVERLEDATRKRFVRARLVR
jgi:hypothetical protein